MLVFSNIELVP